MPRGFKPQLTTRAHSPLLRYVPAMANAFGVVLDGASVRRTAVSVETARTLPRGKRLDILSVWNRAAFIENRTAGQKPNTARMSNMTNTRSSTFQSVFTEQEIISRRSMNSLG